MQIASIAAMHNTKASMQGSRTPLLFVQSFDGLRQTGYQVSKYLPSGRQMVSHRLISGYSVAPHDRSNNGRMILKRLMGTPGKLKGISPIDPQSSAYILNRIF